MTTTMSSSHWLSWRPRSGLSPALHHTCMLVVLTCVVSAATAFDAHYYGLMTPSDPMVVSGSTLELNCTMSDVLEGENVSALYFIRGSLRVPNMYVRVVDNRTVTLQYPNVQRTDSGHWFCRLPGSDSNKLVGQQDVKVADLPVKPNITGCVVYNWENMTCSWEPKVQDTNLPTNQTLYWTLQPHTKKWYHCPHPSGSNCSWWKSDGQNSLHFGRDYSVSVEAKNELGSKVSATHFDTKSIVKPNKVKNLRVSEKGDNYINLTWNPPSINKDIIYKIRYISKRTESWQEVNVTSHREGHDYRNAEWVYLTGLTPYTEYTVNITCLPGSGEGFWSHESVLPLKTNMSVPSAAPVIPPGGFSISSDHDNPDKRKVDVLWQSIPEPSQNGRIVTLRLRYGEEESEVVEFAAPATMRHTLVLDRARTYWVTLEAATPVGYNTSLTLRPLLIPQEDKLPPRPSKLVSVALQEDIVLVNWTAVEEARGYTVYWCKGSSQFGTCDNEMQWTEIDVNSTSHNVTLDSGEDSKQFIFGVSAELLWLGGANRSRRAADVVSSGVLWSDCTYDINKPVSTPKSVDFADHQDALSISLSWEPQHCGETIYIDKYIIFYCKVEDCPAEESGKEGGSIVRVEVDSSRDDFSIEGLEPTEYRVWMRSYSSYKEGLSPPTEPQTITVNQSGPPKVVIVVLSVVGPFVLFFIVFGSYQLYKMFKKKVKENVNVRIERPPEVHHIDRMFDDDRDDYMVQYTNLVDQDQQLSEQNSLIKENQANQRREEPHPNGDISARPCSLSSAPSLPVMQQPGALTAAPPTGVSAGYMSLDALQQLEPNHLLARVYLGDSSAGGRKLNGTASDNLSHNDMVPLHSSATGYDGLAEDMNGAMRALPATPQDVAMKGGAEEQQRPAPGGKVALPYSQKGNSGQQSAGSTIPSYSKCGLPDDGEAAHRGEEPIYQIVDGEEEPSEPPPSVPPPPTYSNPAPAPRAVPAASSQPAGGEQEGTSPATGVMAQAPSGSSKGSPQAPAAQPYTVLPVGEKASFLSDPGYSPWTEENIDMGALPAAGRTTSSIPDLGYSPRTEEPSSMKALPPMGKATSLPDPGYSAALPPAASYQPDPGYSPRTDEPTIKGSISTGGGAPGGEAPGGIAPGGGAQGQSSSSVSPYCQMVSPTDCSSLPGGANKVEQCVDSPSPQVATYPLGDGRNTSDYQQQIPIDPSDHNSNCPIPPEGGPTTASLGSPQNGQLTTAQIPSGHVSYLPFPDAMPSLNIKNSNNGYVTVNM